MAKLPKIEYEPLDIVKEYVPTRGPEVEPNDADPRSGGRLVVRATNSADLGLDRFDQLFAVMAVDLLQSEPPIELDRDDVRVIHYRQKPYGGTYGLEVQVPRGHTVPETFARIAQVALAY